MINFVVCDDKKEIVESIANVIDKLMMNSRVEYKKHLFNSYNADFLELVETKFMKIYILDIEVDKSGIDIARRIRNVDSSSIIIFLTTHLEEGFNVLKGDFMCLSFISKFDDYKKHLERTLKKALSISSVKTISFIEKGVQFQIKEEDILYVYRSGRKSVIVTSNSSFLCSENLNFFSSNKLVQSHKSCFVNKFRIKSINLREKTITLDNDFILDLFSTKFKENFICH